MANSLEKTISLSVRPEREKLVCSCYEALGYHVEKAERREHENTQVTLVYAGTASLDTAGQEHCRALLERLEAIEKQVIYYYLKLVCGVGLAGAACIGLSFAALHFGQHALFTILLILGIFGCTITLYLRPLFTGMGLKKYGGEEPALIAELQALLDLKDGGDKT